MTESQQTPLLDLLRAVPVDARAEYEHSQFHHSMIPYGRLCSDAAQTIAERDAEIARLRGEFEEQRRLRDHFGDRLHAAESDLAAERQRARLPGDLVKLLKAEYSYLEGTHAGETIRRVLAAVEGEK